jgi:hypothetical protein
MLCSFSSRTWNTYQLCTSSTGWSNRHGHISIVSAIEHLVIVFFYYWTWIRYTVTQNRIKHWILKNKLSSSHNAAIEMVAARAIPTTVGTATTIPTAAVGRQCTSNNSWQPSRLFLPWRGRISQTAEFHKPQSPMLTSPQSSSKNFFTSNWVTYMMKRQMRSPKHQTDSVSFRNMYPRSRTIKY